MIDRNCELFNIIPRKKLDYVFKKSSTCGAECDSSFLGFENIYRAVKSIVPEYKVIIDLGCCYAFQSWYFRDHKKYIGVDNGIQDKIVLHTKNSKFYFMSIQKFISEVFPKLGYEKEDVFAICSYVPDEEARRMTREFFPYCLVYYP